MTRTREASFYGWIPVLKELPTPGIKVLAHYMNELGKNRTVMACWIPAKTMVADEFGSPEDYIVYYDEEADEYYWEEGWYECTENYPDLDWYKIYEGNITHWRRLPKPPETNA